MNCITTSRQKNTEILTYKNVSFYGLPGIDIKEPRRWVFVDQSAYDFETLRKFTWREIIEFIDKCEEQPETKYSSVINTYSGRTVDVLNPTPDMFYIDDITHALSHICRFAGHTPIFYPVAQHTLIGLNFIKDPQNKKAFFFHDATEAYINDLVRPLKNQLSEYEKIEHNMNFALAAKFGYQYPFDKEVMEVDDYMLHLELEHFMHKTHDHSHLFPELAPAQVKKLFMQAYNGLNV